MTKVTQHCEIYKCLDSEDLPNEIWKEINGEKRYEISTLGRVRNSETKRIRKQADNGNGYLMFGVQVSDKKSNKQLYIHRAVMLTFEPIENPELYQVDHEDFDRYNNQLSNLRWKTGLENKEHSRLNGRYNEANAKHAIWNEKRLTEGYHNTAKLTPEKVLEIGKLLNQGATNNELAEKFKVPSVNIANIRYGYTWKFVKGFEREVQNKPILKPEIVLEIYNEIKADNTIESVAKKYHVSVAVVLRIRSGERWGSITGVIKGSIDKIKTGPKAKKP